jgi:hypothetical protein
MEEGAKRDSFDGLTLAAFTLSFRRLGSIGNDGSYLFFPATKDMI